MELLLKDEVYAVVGAAMEVYNTLGAGFLEAIYQEALEIELCSRGIPFEPRKPLRVWYKGTCLKKAYQPDIVCFGSLIVEIKGVEQLGPADRRQLLNYLQATGFNVGLLLNFGDLHDLQWKRLVLTRSKDKKMTGFASRIRSIRDHPEVPTPGDSLHSETLG